jgi:hypothetical protein
LTYSPRRRNSPSPSISVPFHQQSQPQSTNNLDYDYDIPYESLFSASPQTQSTSVHMQTQAHLNSVAGSASYPSQKPIPHKIPIAYTAKLADLTAFALYLRTPKKVVDPCAYGEDTRNGMPNRNPNSDSDLSKSDDGIGSVANKSKLAIPVLNHKLN